MNIKVLYLVILLLPISCHQMIAADKEPLVPSQQPAEKAELDKQLKINRDALLKGLTEQMRIDAASVMIFDEHPAARRIILDALTQTENADARAAVCKALSYAREANKHNDIKNKESFISPLLGILQSDDSEIAKLAAEATVIFDYRQISLPLERMVSDSSLPTEHRLNAIYALKLQRDIKAVTKLIKLLGDPVPQIARAAEQALKDAGIPVVNEPADRQQLINELQRKGKEAFLRDWLIRQEAEMNNLEKKSNQWRKLYLSSLDKIYEGKTDDTVRVEFLTEHLGGAEATVKLWALEKVSQWRVGTSSRLPTELGSVLVGLISDSDMAVRLKTAKLLSLMAGLSSAEKLLSQLKVEKDKEVQMELFVALGSACHYAFSPNSGVKVAPQIRKQTLEVASEYLFGQEPLKAEKGAEVIKKLLKQNGLSRQEADNYLDLLVKRYRQEEQNSDNGTLRGKLLGSMAELCVQGVSIAESASEKFGPLLEQTLTAPSDSVREVAVEGLINIDKMSALRKLRKDFVNDRSALVRKKIIDLAGGVGSEEDLVWLAEKTVNKTENEPAWQAMLKIFKRSDAGVLDDWMTRLNAETSDNGLSDEQMISFFEIAEQKAESENNRQMLKKVREKLAGLYGKTGSFESAAEYWGLLLESAESSTEKKEFKNRLLGVYLEEQNVKSAADLLHNYLLEQDPDPNDLVIESLDGYFTELPAGTDPNVLLTELEQLEIAEARPEWEAQKKRWRQIFIAANEPNAPQEPDS